MNLYYVGTNAIEAYDHKITLITMNINEVKRAQEQLAYDTVRSINNEGHQVYAYTKRNYPKLRSH